jgi:DNA-binding CsgD family transcriptional regulator
MSKFIDGSGFIRQRTADLMNINFDGRCDGVQPGDVTFAAFDAPFDDENENGVNGAAGADGTNGSDPNSSKYSQAMTKISDNHQEILRLLSTGMKPKNIAATLEIHVQTVINVKNSDLGKAMLQMLHAERNVTVAKTAERLDALAPKAAEVFESIVFGGDNVTLDLQYKAAKDVLKGRSGLLSEQKSIGHTHAYLTEDEVSDLKVKFKKDFNEDIEDVSFETVENENGEQSEE